MRSIDIILSLFVNRHYEELTEEEYDQIGDWILQQEYEQSQAIQVNLDILGRIFQQYENGV